MIKLVAFDFDDTLCLTEEKAFYLENTVAKQMGHKPMTKEKHLSNWGKPLEEAILKRIPGIDSEEFMRLYTLTVAAAVREGKVDTISDNTIHMLTQLKSQGKRLTILTSRTTKELEHILDENHHINQYIEKIYHFDNVNYRKPDPRAFDHMIADFAVTPQEVIYVGDSLGDAVSAKGAGLHFIASLESGIRTREDFAHLPVDAFVEKLTDILNYEHL